MDPPNLLRLNPRNVSTGLPPSAVGQLSSTRGEASYTGASTWGRGSQYYTTSGGAASSAGVQFQVNEQSKSTRPNASFNPAFLTPSPSVSRPRVVVQPRSDFIVDEDQDAAHALLSLHRGLDRESKCTTTSTPFVVPAAASSRQAENRDVHHRRQSGNCHSCALGFNLRNTSGLLYRP